MKSGLLAMTEGETDCFAPTISGSRNDRGWGMIRIPTFAVMTIEFEIDTPGNNRGLAMTGGISGGCNEL
ncbi:MAG: hypothetical protein V3R96_01015 [Dehalococcoidales bacterium]